MMRSAVESSNVAEVMWENETLFVLFKKNGITGAYDGVPVEKYNGMIAAPSAGGYLNSEIKPFYPYRVVLAPEMGDTGMPPTADGVDGYT